MTVYLLTYDLNKPGQDYSKFYEVRNSYPYARLSESSYAIYSSETPETIFNKLSNYIDSGDVIFIIKLSNPWYGFGDEKIYEWLRNNL